jgi:hypothetical protein
MSRRQADLVGGLVPESGKGTPMRCTLLVCIDAVGAYRQSGEHLVRDAFGFYPALKVSRLQPSGALRYE